MKRLVVIAGPTASGKTALAVELAQRLRTEIVSCDSRQVYSELNIGVARPSADELAAVHHHFIACRSITRPYNAFDYGNDSLAVVNQLFGDNDFVVAVGGSGLYIDALCHGIDVMPDPTPELRQRLSTMVRLGQLDEMLAELQRLDPDYYAVVDRRNPIRIQRALETIFSSGMPYSKIIGKKLPDRNFDIVMLGVHRERAELRQRIDLRVDLMVQAGLIDEVASLVPFRNLNTLNTVGYKEVFDYLDSHKTLDQALAGIKNHTWQYAKKQLNWLKRYDNLRWVCNVDDCLSLLVHNGC